MAIYGPNAGQKSLHRTGFCQAKTPGGLTGYHLIFGDIQSLRSVSLMLGSSFQSEVTGYHQLSGDIQSVTLELDASIKLSDGHSGYHHISGDIQSDLICMTG